MQKLNSCRHPVCMLFRLKLRTCILYLGLNQPLITKPLSETLSFPNAISPDYGDLMVIKDICIIKLGDHTFVQGQLVLQKEGLECRSGKPKIN